MYQKLQKCMALLTVVMMLCASLPLSALAELGAASGDAPVVDLSGADQPFAGAVAKPTPETAEAPQPPSADAQPGPTFELPEPSADEAAIAPLAMTPYSLTLEPLTVTLHYTGDSNPEQQQFTPVYHFGYGANTVDTELAPTDVTWESSDTDVFTVDGAGLVTGGNPGVAKLTATYAVNDEVTVTASVSIVVTNKSMRLTYRSNYPADATTYYYDSYERRTSLVPAENTGVYEDYLIDTEVTLADPAVMFSATNYTPVGYFEDLNDNGEFDEGEPEYGMGDTIGMTRNVTLMVRWEPIEVVRTMGVYVQYSYINYEGNRRDYSTRTEGTVTAWPDGDDGDVTVSFFLYGAYELSNHQDTISDFRGWRLAVHNVNNDSAIQDNDAGLNDSDFTKGHRISGYYTENQTITLTIPKSWLTTDGASYWANFYALPQAENSGDENIVNATFFVLKRTFDNQVGVAHTDKYYNVGYGTIDISRLKDLSGEVRAGGEDFLFSLTDLDSLIERNVTSNVDAYVVDGPSDAIINEQTNGAMAPNQKVVWYVVKHYAQGWYVDGIIVNTDPNLRVQFRDATSREGQDELLQEDLVEKGGSYDMSFVPDDTVFSQEDLHQFKGWSTEPGGRPLTDEELRDLLTDMQDDVVLYACYEDYRGVIVYYVDEFGNPIDASVEDYVAIEDGMERVVESASEFLKKERIDKGNGDLYTFDYTTFDTFDAANSNVAGDMLSTSASEPIIVITHHYYEMVDVVVTKRWSDENDKDHHRPGSVTVRLLADGTPVDGGEQILSDGNGWSYTWTNLRKYKANAATRADLADYTVQEDPVEGYQILSITKRESQNGKRTVITLEIDNALHPEWEIEKLVNGKKRETDKKPGDELEYTIRVTNTGDVTLNGLLVYDEFVGGHPEMRRDLTSTDDTKFTASGSMDGTYLGVINNLAPGEEVTLTYYYTIQLDDLRIEIGEGSDQKITKIYEIVNTATVKSESHEETDTTTTEILQTPLWTVRKVAMVNGRTLTDEDAVRVGDKVVYRITVTNTGNVYLQNMKLNDLFDVNELAAELTNWRPSPDAGFDLAVGKSRVFQAEYTVQAGDKQLDNWVSAGWDDPDDPHDETHNDVVGWTVDKIALVNGAPVDDGTPVHEGDKIVYQITVKNIGNVNVTLKLEDAFDVSDVQTGLALYSDDGTAYDGAAFTLEPEQEKIFLSASYEVLEGVKGKLLHNYVKVYDPEDPDHPEEDETKNPVPKWSVEKVALVNGNPVDDGTNVKVGDTVVYRITVTNEGVEAVALALKDAFYVDGAETPLTLYYDDQATVYGGESFEVQPGESKYFYSAAYEVEENVTGKLLHNEVKLYNPDDEDEYEEDETDNGVPKWSVEKVALVGGEPVDDFTPVHEGDVVVYQITVTNEGDVDVTLELTDAFSVGGAETALKLRYPDGAEYRGEQFTVKAGASRVFYSEPYTVSEDDSGKLLHNVVTVTDPLDPDHPEEDETNNPVPDWSVEKVAVVNGAKVDDTVKVKAGDEVVYRITVTNDGDTGVELLLEDVFTVAGAETALKLRYPDGAEYRGEAFEVAAGEAITFESEVFVVPEEARGETLHNVVTVTDPDDPDDPQDDETENEVENPRWTVTKVASVDGVDLTDDDTVKVGDTVVYTITVTNTGNVDLTLYLRDVFTVNGVRTALSNWRPDPAAPFALAVDGVKVFTAEYVVKNGDRNLHNVVVADDDPYDPDDPEDPDDPDDPPPSDETDNNVDPDDPEPSDEPQPSDEPRPSDEPHPSDEPQPSDEPESHAAHPHMTVRKVTVSQPANGVAYRRGETIAYEITVTNDGDVALENIDVIDSLNGTAGQVLGTIERLEPGETSSVYAYSHVVTADDVDAGEVVNVATAEADNPNYDPNNPDDPENPRKVPAEPGRVEAPTESAPAAVPRTTLTGTKTWVDNDDADGMRPEEIEIVLYADGVAQRNVPTWTKNGNVWTYTFTNLPVNNAQGQPIAYTVAETPVEYYVATQNGLDITNTIVDKEEVALIEVSGAKLWRDSDNASGLRPASITVELLRDGETYLTATVTEADGWRYAFADLPEGDGYGNRYAYTVREQMVTYYYTMYDGTDIINMLVPHVENFLGTPKGPDFSAFTEEELAQMISLFDYGVPLLGMLLKTGLEIPMYPFFFAGLGVLALALAIALDRRKAK